MTHLIEAEDAVLSVSKIVFGLPVYIAGSAAAAAQYDSMQHAYDDIDVFASTPQAMIAAIQRLMDIGEYAPTDRMQRVWQRWMKHGFNGWHTNSLKLRHPITELEVNVIYKLVDKHPTKSLAEVIESFDFGLLAVGYDCETAQWRDMRSYLFPLSPYSWDTSKQAQHPLPLMPNRRDTWRNGFISQYQGLREVGRYIKYLDYGWDMSLVKDDLLTGYREAELYLSQRTDTAEKVQLGLIYGTIANHIEDDELDKLREAASEINLNQLDDLDAIMEALE